METLLEVTGRPNLGNPQEKTVLKLAQLVVDLAGSRSEIVFQTLRPTEQAT